MSQQPPQPGRTQGTPAPDFQTPGGRLAMLRSHLETAARLVGDMIGQQRREEARLLRGLPTRFRRRPGSRQSPRPQGDHAARAAEARRSGRPPARPDRSPYSPGTAGTALPRLHQRAAATAAPAGRPTATPRETAKAARPQPTWPEPQTRSATSAARTRWRQALRKLRCRPRHHVASPTASAAWTRTPRTPPHTPNKTVSRTAAPQVDQPVSSRSGASATPPRRSRPRHPGRHCSAMKISEPRSACPPTSRLTGRPSRRPRRQCRP